MERLLVTGGLGRSGRWIVEDLAADHEILCVDQQRGHSERERVDVRTAELTDRGEVFDLVTEFDPDAVVHWAAIPDPLDHAGGRVFANNVESTFHVLDAAGRVGADVVWASSESAFGFPFAEETPLPDFLPLTEAHPLRPADPYGTSKVVGEEIAEMVVRRDGVSVASIRPSWIQYPSDYPCLDVDPPEGGLGNFWSYVDVRDVVGIVRAALEGDVEGHEPFLVAAADTYAERPIPDLVREHFGEVPETCDVDHGESAISTAKARELLGWEPTHSWREAADEDVPEPAI